MRHQDEIVPQSHLLRLIHRHRIGRRSGLETYGEEYNLLFRILRRDLHRIGGRVHNAHIAASCFYAEQIARRPGHAQHVAK